MDKVAVIANPVASQFTGGDHRTVMAELSRVYDVEAMWPGSATEATQDARSAAESGADIVVATGGDGMVHHVAQGLIGTDAAMAIIPAGTTNVVARLLGIPARQTRAARFIARSPNIEKVSTVELELHRGTTTTSHHVIFACGFGIDAEVVQVADADPYRKYRFGSLHYARSAIGVGLRTFPSREPHITFKTESRTVDVTAALIQFRTIYTYFGKIGLRFRDDGPNPMSALILDRLKRRRIPSVFASALLHRDLAKIPGFDVIDQISEFELTADPAVAVQADGENLGLVDGARGRWIPDSLKVLRAPSSSG